MSGVTGTQAEVLYSLAAAITKNTFTAKAAITGVLGTNTVCKIPAGWAANDVPNPVGRSLALKIRGIIANTAAATFAAELDLNTTAGTALGIVVVNTAYTPTAGVTAPFALDAEYTITAYATSTMSLQVNGSMVYEQVAAGGAPSTTSQRVGFQGLLTGVDPRVDQFVELMGTWSASSASNTTTVHQMKLYGEN